MYCPLPQYEARLWMGGDVYGTWTHDLQRDRLAFYSSELIRQIMVTLAGYDPAKLRLERAVTLPIRPQGQIRVAKGWGADPHAVSRTNGFQDRACSRAS